VNRDPDGHAARAPQRGRRRRQPHCGHVGRFWTLGEPGADAGECENGDGRPQLAGRVVQGDGRQGRGGRGQEDDAYAIRGGIHQSLLRLDS
jgi:hypothetical protein